MSPTRTPLSLREQLGLVKLLPPDAARMLAEAAKDDHAYRLRSIARARRKVVELYPQFFKQGASAR